MSARSRFDLDNELNRNGGSGNDEDIEEKTATFRQVNPLWPEREHANHSNFAEKKLFLYFLAKSNQSEMSKENLENLQLFIYKNLVD